MGVAAIATPRQPGSSLEDSLAERCKTLSLAASVTLFRYLWIDTLCINQDDSDEKEHEIAYISEIYSHATLNLSVTAAYDGSGGLFFERDLRIVGEYHSEHHPGVVAFVPSEQSFVGEVLRAPTSKRASVFQERMLSTRVLHFCRTRLFWECCMVQEAEPVSSGIRTFIKAALDQTKKLVLPRQKGGDLDAERARFR